MSAEVHDITMDELNMSSMTASLSVCVRIYLLNCPLLVCKKILLEGVLKLLKTSQIKIFGRRQLILL